MNLGLATSDTFERTVIRPLVTSVERLAITREGSTNRLLEIPTLERRISLLDTQMTRHINVTMSDAKIDMLDSLQDDLQRNLKAEFRTENTTFNKVEGGIVQRFESAAGTITRNIHSEGASRYVTINLFGSFCRKAKHYRIVSLTQFSFFVPFSQPVCDCSTTA